MIEVGILKNFDSVTYKAAVQLVGSPTTYFDDVSVARNIPAAAMIIGNHVILAVPGGNPKHAVVIATWPGGSAGGGPDNIYDLLYTCRFPPYWYADITTSTTGSATVLLQGFRAYLQTGTTINSIARCYSLYSGVKVIDTYEPIYEVDMAFSVATQQQAQFGLCLPTDPTGATGSIGIDILNDAIRAFSSDGSTRSVLDLATTISPGSYQTVKQCLVSGALKTWIDGVAKADKTNNLPVNKDIKYWTVRLTNTEAQNKTLGITTPKIAWKP